MMRLALLLMLLATPAAAQAVGGKVYRLGVLSPSAASVEITRSTTLPELAKLGFSEGSNLVVDERVGVADTLPIAVHEMLRAEPDAIIAIGPEAVHAAHGATTTVPIVVFSIDPVLAGDAASRAHPGGNVTGVAILAAELDGKRLDLLHEAVPAAHRVAALLLTGFPGQGDSEREMHVVATSSGIELLTFDTAQQQDYSAAFVAMRAAGAQALVIAANPVFYRDAEPLATLALAAGLPTVCEWSEMARSGCLLGYGPSRTELRRRLAHYVARIFQGAAPGDLPIETATRFEFAINLNTAKALGLTVPPSLLARADEVIE